MLDVKRVIDIINKLGYNTYTFDYSIYNTYIQVMLDWYRGQVNTFHTETVYNGAYEVRVDKSRLNMAKRVCEDLASLVTNENLSVLVNSPNEKDFLLGYDEMTGILGQNDFWTQLARIYELTCALGTGAFEIVAEGLFMFKDKILSNDNSKLKIVTHNATEIIPLSWDNNLDIKEVAFVDQYKIKNDKFIDLRLHVLVDGIYHIINKRLRVFDGGSYIFEDSSDILTDFDTKSNVPWFSIIKLPLINNYCIESPMGASVYGNCVDLLKSIDNCFDMLTTEIKHGQKKIFYDKRLCERDKQTGKVIYPDDKNNGGRLVFYYMGDEFNGNADDSNGLIHEFNPELRIDDITKALEGSLNYLSNMCGLGNSYYKFEQGTVQKTATEVISENSSMYRNIRKNEIALEKSLLSLFRSLLYANNMIFGTSFNIDVPISIQFDQSIIEDKGTIRKRELEEVKLGILDKQYYIKKYYSTNRRDAVELKGDA